MLIGGVISELDAVCVSLTNYGAQDCEAFLNRINGHRCNVRPAWPIFLRTRLP